MTVSTLPRLGAMPNALLLPMLPILVLCALGFVFFAPAVQVPEQIPYWAFFFGLPHIVASLQTMCDAEYLVAYKRQNFIVAGLILLPFVLALAGFPAPLVMALVLIWTVYHVIAQQFGIALAVARLRPSRLSALCKWSTILLGTVAFFQSYLQLDLLGSGPQGLFPALTLLLLAVIAVSGAVLTWQARASRQAAVLLALNILLFVLALLFIFWTPYALVGLILARVLHDVSGFVVYVQHDTARNRERRKNLLYRLLPFLPVWLLSLSFALGIAGGLTYLSARVGGVSWLVMGITIAHYYIESVIWRGGTPHRRYVNLSGA